MRQYKFFFSNTLIVFVVTSFYNRAMYFIVAVFLIQCIAHERNDTFISYNTGDNRSLSPGRTNSPLYPSNLTDPAIHPLGCRDACFCREDRRSSCYCCRLIKKIDERLSSSSRLAPRTCRVLRLYSIFVSRLFIRLAVWPRYCAPESRHF